MARSRVAAEQGIHALRHALRQCDGLARFGHPALRRQIRQGQPLTVTDPQMTRFMMSLDDAVDLVIYAFEHATPGDLSSRRRPAATIGTLAEA